LSQLITERLIIRSFLPDDWQDLYDYLSDPEVVKFEPYEVFNIQQCQKEATLRAVQEFFLAVCLKNSKKLIGNLYFEQTEPKAFSTWELGYVFNSKYQKNGYATEACSAILEYAFGKMHIRRVVARCNPQNTASWKLLERLHFRREGHLLQHSFFKYDGQENPIWQDVYEYAILAEEWLSQNPDNE
jgi:[ribosomal protein S5]-alanine N-acetyltransferase